MSTAETQAPDVSVVVLCYRAGQSIHRVIEPLYALLKELDASSELVLVANYWPNQHDPTPAIVREFAQTRPDVIVVTEEKQGAMGWDMRSGLSVARGRVLVAIDGDAQNPVEDAIRIYKLMNESGADVMKGRRIQREDGLYRRLVSLGYNLLFLLRFRTWGLWDINGKPKAMTAAAYEQLNLESDDWFIDAEIVLKARDAGLTVRELPVVFRQNEERASFVRVSAILEFLRNMARYGSVRIL